jgi:hypothetical protein
VIVQGVLAYVSLPVRIWECENIRSSYIGLHNACTLDSVATGNTSLDTYREPTVTISPMTYAPTTSASMSARNCETPNSAAAKWPRLVFVHTQQQRSVQYSVTGGL